MQNLIALQKQNFLTCLLFLFQKNVHSKVFVTYICNNVLPGLSDMASPEEGVDNKLDMLKLLAEISDFNGFSQEEVQTPLSNVFTRLIVSTQICHKYVDY